MSANDDNTNDVDNADNDEDEDALFKKFNKILLAHLKYLQELAIKYDIDETTCNLSVLGLQTLLFFDSSSDRPYHEAKSRLLHAIHSQQIKNKDPSYFGVMPTDAKTPKTNNTTPSGSTQSVNSNKNTDKKENEAMFTFTCQVFQIAHKDEKHYIWKQTHRMHKYIYRIYDHRHPRHPSSSRSIKKPSEHPHTQHHQYHHKRDPLQKQQQQQQQLPHKESHLKQKQPQQLPQPQK